MLAGKKKKKEMGISIYLFHRRYPRRFLRATSSFIIWDALYSCRHRRWSRLIKKRCIGKTMDDSLARKLRSKNGLTYAYLLFLEWRAIWHSILRCKNKKVVFLRISKKKESIVRLFFEIKKKYSWLLCDSQIMHAHFCLVCSFSFYLQWHNDSQHVYFITKHLLIFYYQCILSLGWKCRRNMRYKNEYTSIFW